MRLYSLISFDICAAAAVHSFLGETWDGKGEVAGVYFRKGRKRWM